MTATLTEEQIAALLALAEATTEAVYGCESEITGRRLRLLNDALDAMHATGLAFPEAQHRGQHTSQ